ncbi:hypothetical protein ACFQX6_19015 [Streptosporangium lutulentum]
MVLENHTRMLHEMAQAVRAGKTPKPDVVVLPENSTDIDPCATPSPTGRSTRR